MDYQCIAFLLSACAGVDGQFGTFQSLRPASTDVAESLVDEWHLKTC